MRAELINPVVLAACDIMRQELGLVPERGPLRLEQGHYRTADVNVIVGITGDIRGSLILGLADATAIRMAAKMMGCPGQDLGMDLVHSGIAELSNCIAGRACINLSEVDYQSDLTTPTLLLGAGSRVSTVNIPRVCMHLTTEWGLVDLQIALTA